MTLDQQPAQLAEVVPGQGAGGLTGASGLRHDVPKPQAPRGRNGADERLQLAHVDPTKVIHAMTLLSHQPKRDLAFLPPPIVLPIGQPMPDARVQQPDRVIEGDMTDDPAGRLDEHGVARASLGGDDLIHPAAAHADLIVLRPVGDVRERGGEDAGR